MPSDTVSTGTISPATAGAAGAVAIANTYLTAHTPEQQELATLMDGLVSDIYFASCLEGEADKIYLDLVAYANDPASSPVNADSIENADAALALMRRLGGTWSGDGCLEVAANAAQYVLDSAHRGDDEDVLGRAEQLNPAATWVSLEEMAARTGQALPA